MSLVRCVQQLRAGVGLLLAGILPVAAGPLPDPLTIEAALQAGGDYPSLALGRAQLAERKAHADEVLAQDGLDVGATLEARVVDPPSTALDQSNNDSRAVLFARKRLYDFGHTRALEQAASSAVAAGKLQTDDQLQAHRIAILQAFFDVLLADLEFARDNELMAVAYVTADRSRDRNELGQVSDPDLLEQETRFQQVRIQRTRSQARQRSTRALLAQLLDQPDQLPATLVTPDLPPVAGSLPEYDALVDAMLLVNPQVLALRAELESARMQVRAERKAGRPVLSGSVAAAANERNVGSRNPFEAELRLEIPLYDGGRTDADVARAQTDVYRVGAELRQLEYDLRQQLLEYWLEAQTLLAQREQVRVFARSRALNFDRAQAEYEMELKTDFGTALVGQSEVALLQAQTEFALALNLARITALTGEPLSPYIPVAEFSSSGSQSHE